MRIDIDLDDIRLCDGCPCLHMSDGYGGVICSLEYFDEAIFAYINPHNDKISMKNYNGWLICTLRPQKCIDEHGE